MREIEKEMGALKDVMADVHNLVEEGREGLDVVEEHVTHADKNTKQAVDELVIVCFRARLFFSCSSRLLP